MTSLAEAQQQVKDNLDKGANCPCCGQYAKRYKRALTGAMAYAMVIVGSYQKKKQSQGGEGWVHVENLLKDTQGIPSSIRGDFGKLIHFGLVEHAWGKREDGSTRNGYYRVTGKGFDFLAGNITVPSHVFIYNDNVEGFTDTYVNIKDVIKKNFDYTEIMRKYELPEEPKPGAPMQLFDPGSTAGPPLRKYH